MGLQPTKALGFLGDYMGLTNASEDFLALFSQPPDGNPVSVFTRHVG
jgi:hypothetical protein